LTLSYLFYTFHNQDLHPKYKFYLIVINIYMRNTETDMVYYCTLLKYVVYIWYGYPNTCFHSLYFGIDTKEILSTAFSYRRGKTTNTVQEWHV
jgi:hypothetical protein